MKTHWLLGIPGHRPDKYVELAGKETFGDDIDAFLEVRKQSYEKNNLKRAFKPPAVPPPPEPKPEPEPMFEADTRHHYSPVTMEDAQKSTQNLQASLASLITLASTRAQPSPVHKLNNELSPKKAFQVNPFTSIKSTDVVKKIDNQEKARKECSYNNDKDTVQSIAVPDTSKPKTRGKSRTCLIL